MPAEFLNIVRTRSCNAAIRRRAAVIEAHFGYIRLRAQPQPEYEPFEHPDVLAVAKVQLQHFENGSQVVGGRCAAREISRCLYPSEERGSVLLRCSAGRQPALSATPGTAAPRAISSHCWQLHMRYRGSCC